MAGSNLRPNQKPKKANYTVNDARRDIYLVISRTWLLKLQMNTPKGSGGILAASWMLENPKGFLFQISTPHKYALYVEKGTKPHVILPKRKQALYFEWTKVGGQRLSRKGRLVAQAKAKKRIKPSFVMFKKVQHPGFKARRFIEKTMNDKATKKEFEDGFRDILKKI